MTIIDTKAGGLTEQGINGVDDAVANAKARVAARKAAKGEGNTAAPTVTEGEKQARKKLTPEERIQRQVNLEAERADRARAREKAREAKKAEVQATRGTPHMSKVEKAAAGLAPLDADAQALFDEIKGGLGGAQIDALLGHLAFYRRAESTKGSLDLKLAEGTNVRIVSGPPKLIGKTGVVVKWQRVHCYIEVPGLNKPAYLFNANVEALAPETSEPEAPAPDDAVASSESAAPAPEADIPLADEAAA